MYDMRLFFIWGSWEIFNLDWRFVFFIFYLLVLNASSDLFHYFRINILINTNSYTLNNYSIICKSIYLSSVVIYTKNIWMKKLFGTNDFLFNLNRLDLVTIPVIYSCELCRIKEQIIKTKSYKFLSLWLNFWYIFYLQ